MPISTKNSPAKVYKVSELQQIALTRRANKEIFVKGYDCGFRVLDDLMSFRLGYPTGIYSYSGQGKTQFYIEQAVHLSKKHGLKHAIWLTETGKKEEIIMDIAMTVMRKSLFSPNVSVTDEELVAALNWMEDYFFIIDHEEAMLNVRDIYSAVRGFEQETGIKVNCIGIDNATNLARETDKTRLQTHEYMNYLMLALNRTSLAKQYHTFILFHVNKPEFTIECPDTKKRYHPCPTHYEIVGGQQINYLGYQLICVWRPIQREEQAGIINPETGIPFELNETHIVISKSKPKAIGMLGRGVIYFDRDRSAYYEKLNGRNSYCGEWNETAKPPKPKASPSPGVNGLPLSNEFLF